MINHKHEVIYGTRAIIEAIRSGKEFEKVLIQKNVRNELTSEMFSLIKERKIPYLQVPVEKLNRVTRKNHQGAIAYISPINYSSTDHIISSAYESGEVPLLLVLDRITDVRNFGAIARTAECAGVHGIIIPDKGGALISSDAVKTSAGGLNYVPVARSSNLKNDIKNLKENGLYIVACTEKSDKEIFEIDMNRPVAIIIGSEENGISEEYLKLSDERGKIPIKGQIESLNVSVAAGIVLFEAIRQRQL